MEQHLTIYIYIYLYIHTYTYIYIIYIYFFIWLKRVSHNSHILKSHIISDTVMISIFISFSFFFLSLYYSLWRRGDSNGKSDKEETRGISQSMSRKKAPSALALHVKHSSWRGKFKVIVSNYYKFSKRYSTITISWCIAGCNYKSAIFFLPRTARRTLWRSSKES